MKKKERKHKIPQANTLETSKKTLQKAVLNAVHNGGFLFARDPDGLFGPVVVNATISDMVGAVLSFIVSRTNTAEELSSIKDYLTKATEQVCSLRKIDIEGMAERAMADAKAVAALITEAESAASPADK